MTLTSKDRDEGKVWSGIYYNELEVYKVFNIYILILIFKLLIIIIYL